jgi:hypothetical protein
MRYLFYVMSVAVKCSGTEVNCGDMVGRLELARMSRYTNPLQGNYSIAGR